MDIRYIKAMSFAKSHHGKQKYGIYPYFFHLDAVTEYAKPYGTEAMIVAQLHDIIEDTSATFDEIFDLFGETVANAVSYITDVNLDDRFQRKQEMNQRLFTLKIEDKCSRLALIVKTCDRLANVKASSIDSRRHYRMYQSEHEDFRKAVYRKGLCEELWQQLNPLIYANECELVR
jgi:(p)ppGpp synthase/HD superfamily hydrolase